MTKESILKIIEEVKALYPEKIFPCDVGKGARLACDVMKHKIEENGLPANTDRCCKCKSEDLEIYHEYYYCNNCGHRESYSV